MGTLPAAHDLVDWWTDQLRGLALRKRAPVFAHTLEVDQNGLRWLDEEKSARHSGSCAILIRQPQYLRRRLAELKLPYTRALAIASIDVIQQTPFAVSDIVVIPFCSSDQQGSFYCVIKKVTVELCRQALIQKNLEPSAIVLQTDNGYVHLPKRSTSAFMVPRSLVSRLRLWALAFPLFAATILVGHIYLKLDQARTNVATQLGDLQIRAKSARELIDERQRSLSNLESVRQLKSNRVPLGLAWGELSRILPDNAWLTDFSVRGTTMTISGFAGKAVSLIPALDGSPLFTSPAFVNATSKLPGHEGEHFDIQLEIVQQP